MSLVGILDEEVSSRSSIVVQDSLQAPGHFMVALLLKQALKQGDKVVFVALGQPWSHYKQVMRKLVVDMDDLSSRGSLIFISFQTGFAGEDLCREMYGEIASAICKLQAGAVPGTQLSLFIDDASVMSALSKAPLSDASKAVHSARGLCCALEVAFRYVCLMHLDVEADKAWTAGLRGGAEVVITVESLGSASDDVHGQVSVQHKKAWSGTRGPLARSFYYCFTDGGMRFREAP